MKINEITIVESQGQLNEGVVDTLKQKLDDLVAKASAKYPGLSDAIKLASSHKQELSTVIEKFQASGAKPSKETILAAIEPVVGKVASQLDKTSMTEAVQVATDKGGLAHLSSGVGLLYVVSFPLRWLWWLLDRDSGTFGGFMVWNLIVIAACYALYRIGADDYDRHTASELRKKETAERNRLSTADSRVQTSAPNVDFRSIIDKLMSQYSTSIFKSNQYDILEDMYRDRTYDMSYGQKRQLEQLYDEGYNYEKNSVESIKNKIITQICEKSKISMFDFNTSSYANYLNNEIEKAKKNR